MAGIGNSGSTDHECSTLGMKQSLPQSKTFNQESLESFYVVKTWIYFFNFIDFFFLHYEGKMRRVAGFLGRGKCIHTYCLGIKNGLDYTYVTISKEFIRIWYKYL